MAVRKINNKPVVLTFIFVSLNLDVLSYESIENDNRLVLLYFYRVIRLWTKKKFNDKSVHTSTQQALM